MNIHRATPTPAIMKSLKTTDIILRLHLLRKISFLMHAEQSRLLAVGQQRMARIFAKDEEEVEALRTQLSTRIPDPFLLAALGSERLLRTDRKWESSIAAEASYVGWKFLVLKATVKLGTPSSSAALNGTTTLEHWQNSLDDLLWPRGVVLWAESDKGGLLEQQATGLVWRGTWWVVASPGLAWSELPIEKIPGWVPESKVEWRVIEVPCGNSNQDKTNQV